MEISAGTPFDTSPGKHWQKELKKFSLHCKAALLKPLTLQAQTAT